MSEGIPWWKLISARLIKTAEPPPETHLTSVRAVSQAVAASLDLNEVLEAVLDQVSRIFDTTNFYIATYEGESDEWTTVLHLEHGQRQPVVRRKITAGLTGHIIRSRQPLLFRSLEENIAFDKALGSETIGERAKSWMGVPLVADDKVVGVMAIQSYEQEGLYGEEDLALFSTIAAQVAIAVRNARLHQETRRRADEMALLQEINHTLGMALSLQETMEALILNLQRMIPHDGGEVCLYDPDRKLLETMVALGEVVDITSAQAYALDEGYTGWVGRHRQPLLIKDCAAFTEARPQREEAIAEGQLASYLGVPIVIGDRLIGTLELASSQRAAFDQQHLHLLTLVAAQTAAAIERARLFEELSRRLQEAHLLFEVNESIISTLSPQEVLDMIVQACVEAIPAADKGSLHLLDEESGELRIHAAVGYGPEVVQTVRIKLGQGCAGRVAQTGEPAIVEELREETLAFHTGLPQVQQIRSMICVPLRARDRTIGVISIDNVHTTHAFRQEDLETLSAFAGQAAIAIENARLYEQLSQQVNHLQRLSAEVSEASSKAQALVQTSAEAIAALDERSRAIGPFVVELEQFAEQTDLLAINAAIEAARAGRHGLGFAVVADEVRRLAESSSTAAGEIATLNRQIIEETQRVVERMERVRQAVEQTTQLAQESATAMRDGYQA
jgi:GAF domain-containing protein